MQNNDNRKFSFILNVQNGFNLWHFYLTWWTLKSKGYFKNVDSLSGLDDITQGFIQKANEDPKIKSIMEDLGKEEFIKQKLPSIDEL